jgi:proton-translocating NADH-quinone oxidoreductase chain L
MAPSCSTLLASRSLPALGWLLFFPLLGAFVNGLLGARLESRFGRACVHVVALSAVGGAALVALDCLIKLIQLPADSRFLHSRLFSMIEVGGLRADFGLALDPLSALLVLIITFVGFGIHLYATRYMELERTVWRFFALLNFFVFAMLLLVLGDNLLTLFFGWEGVGLASYLLIGYWYEESKNARAGLKAFIVNRVGDAGLLAGIFVLFWGLAGSWPAGRVYQSDTAFAHSTAAPRPTLSFQELHDQMEVTTRDGAHPVAEALSHRTFGGMPLLFVVCLLFLIAAVGKSAQLPLYVWLPDAMAGPTPVSALIHAATMVTAGVYLIVRLHFLFVLSPGAMTVLAALGALTALFGAVVALFQYDLKRVLAYSTISQLGFMMMAAGVGAYSASIFHLLTHACFKACLFLAAGSVIHGMHSLTRAHHASLDTLHHSRLEVNPHDVQDMRNMGGLGPLMPKTRLAYLIACWAIAGFPWAAGFFSKDEILWHVFGNHSTWLPGPVLYAMGLTAAGCTSFYMFRSYYMTFSGRPTQVLHREHVHESPGEMTSVLLVLAGICLVVGPTLGLPKLVSGREPMLIEWLAPVLHFSDGILSGGRAFANGRGLETALMLLSLLVAMMGWALAHALYADLERSEAWRSMGKRRHAQLHAFALDAFGVDGLYDRVFVHPFVALSQIVSWIDGHIVNSLVDGTAKIARAVAWSNGAIDRYLVDGAVNGISRLAIESGRQVRLLQTGRIGTYVLGMAFGIIVLIAAFALG